MKSLMTISFLLIAFISNTALASGDAPSEDFSLNYEEIKSSSKAKKVKKATHKSKKGGKGVGQATQAW